MNTSTSKQVQYVWAPLSAVEVGLDYVDDLILRDDNSTSGNLGISSSGLGRRVFVQSDANWNTTSLLDSGGTVQARFVYDPYGNVHVLDSSGSPTTDSYNWTYLHQGGRLDPATGNYIFRHRDYRAALGRWLEQDPLGYTAGVDLYQSESDEPTNWTDPYGLVISGPRRPPPPPIYSSQYPFVAGRGTFGATLTVHTVQTALPTPGPQSGTIYTSSLDPNAIDIDIKVYPNASVTSNCCQCTYIDFVQYYTDKYEWWLEGWVWQYNPWQVDGSDPYGQTAKGGLNAPWINGNRLTTFAHMQDAPGDNNLYYWEVNYKSDAMCRGGTDKGKSYGTLDWGWTIDWSTHSKQYRLAGKVTNWLAITDTTAQLSFP